MADDTHFTFDERWNLRFMGLAKTISTWSKDESTKVGCVIIGPSKEVRSMGYNGFPRGVSDNIPTRHERPAKYQYTEHAERNAIYNTTYYGGSVRGCSLFVTMPPCVDCARAIIQSGIQEVIFLNPESDTKKHIPGWRDTLAASFEMFDEVGIRYKALNASMSSESAQFTDIKFMVPPVEMDDLSNKLISKNGLAYQVSMCLEELDELSTELLEQIPSFDNIAGESADTFITLNHIVCGYNIRQDVDTAISRKILNPNFLNTRDEKIVAFLQLQKQLLKNINRRQDNLTEIINRTADAYIALIKLIIERNSFSAVHKYTNEKIARTIERNKLSR